jgi:hypothetical protein
VCPRRCEASPRDDAASWRSHAPRGRIPGDNTFSNYAEANRTFWRNTVVPVDAEHRKRKFSRAADSLSDWLGPAFSETPLKLAPDLDEVEALAPEREALWARLEKTSFLTNDEKRAIIGYGPVGSATPDKLFNPGQPRVPGGTSEGGRWAGDVHPAAHAPRGPTDIQGKPRSHGGEGGGGGSPGVRSTGDILKPGGKDVGVSEKGAGSDIRTVSPSELQSLEKELLGGSTREISSPRGYDGKWYLREDGSIVGVRESSQYGKTLDIVDPAGSNVKRGYKVHSK